MPRRKPSGRTANQSVTIDLDTAELAGLGDVFRALPDSFRNQIARPIVDRLVKMGARTAKLMLVRMLPKRDPLTRRWQRPTGALRDSLGSKTVPASKMRDKTKVIGMFGARRDFRVSKMTTKLAGKLNMEVRRPTKFERTFRSPRNKFIIPSRYIHLVEFGHSGSRYFPAARPYPFMRAASQSLTAIVPIVVRTLYNEKFNQVFNAAIRRAQNPNRRSYVRRAPV